MTSGGRPVKPRVIHDRGKGFSYLYAHARKHNQDWYTPATREPRLARFGPRLIQGTSVRQSPRLVRWWELLETPVDRRLQKWSPQMKQSQQSKILRVGGSRGRRQELGSRTRTRSCGDSRTVITDGGRTHVDTTQPRYLFLTSNCSGEATITTLKVGQLHRWLYIASAAGRKFQNE